MRPVPFDPQRHLATSGSASQRPATWRHFLDDGDSPDIPIPVYVGHLNRIREMAMEVRP